jgi:hypothetical protein
MNGGAGWLQCSRYLVWLAICAKIWHIVSTEGNRADRQERRKEWRWVALVILALLFTSSLPYLIAWAATPNGSTFTGLVFNPLDANSYIAKMRQGFRGSWLFQLPYTPESHAGAHVFLYHLFLGHLARTTGLSLIMVYHGLRLCGGAAMLVALYALASRLTNDVAGRRVMFAVAALGSGLGWLLGPLGIMTADLWVPEAFPPYALLVNAHFPLAMALMMGIILCGLTIGSKSQEMQNGIWLQGVGMALAAVLLGVIQPFGLVTVFGALGVMLAVRTFVQRAVPWRMGIWVIGAAVAALPYPIYMQRALRADPVLAAWMAQNVTASPPVWDWVLSYGLVFALAVPGVIAAVRRSSDTDWMLLGWVATTFVGMYLPLPLQRRLALGLGVPLGLLAGIGWWRVVRPRVGVRRRRLVQNLMLVLCAMTSIFLMLVTSLAAVAGESWFYLSEGERAALEWLRDEAETSTVVLCAPQTGLFVPAWAGQRVVYGHPFETVDAERREAQVTAYWAGEMSPAQQEAFLWENRVDYVLVGPRELEIGDWSLDITELEGEPVFDAGDVRIYDVTRW